MIYQSEELSVQRLKNNIAEIHFDRKGESVNKFDVATVESLNAALTALEAEQGIKGLLVSSGKPAFIVGADIVEFIKIFSASSDEIMSILAVNNRNFNRLEKLPYPTCVAINGFALGGGFEVTLACDFRVMSQTAKVGLPETKLGIMPGWGGTVRLPRIIGVDEAVTWIATGADHSAEATLKAGAIDAVASPEELREVALQTLQGAIEGQLDYQQRRALKNSALPMNSVEATLAFTSMKSMVAQQAGNNYPAPVRALESMEQSHRLVLTEALQIEAETFAALAKTDVAAALVGVFLADQLLTHKAKTWEKSTDQPVNRAAVLGAGIMGGGIAYQSAYKGVPINMKDIAQQGLDLGLAEANKLLARRVAKGRMTPQKMGEVLNSIDPTLTYGGFDQVDIVVEAVVENPKVKRAVLAEAEQQIAADAVLVSNTSTISITHLAKALDRPQNFCGMHFFNPVHAMPLVEVIRGEKTSDNTIARTVAYARKMGKKPVVVNDCPGFLVNRVLFPYFDGFAKLLRDGADYQQVDKVMEKWGWPMGPAYLLDVVGLDTAVHAAGVMADGFPDRMQPDFKSATDVLFQNQRYGQKNNKGFYDYALDKRGRLKKSASSDALKLIAPVVAEPAQFDSGEIIFRTLLPMATELARCLEEGVVGTPAEADLALLYGLGFPPFRGGVFRWIDTIGLEKLAAASEKFSYLGKGYQLTDDMLENLTNAKTYY